MGPCVHEKRNRVLTCFNPGLPYSHMLSWGPWAQTRRNIQWNGLILVAGFRIFSWFHVLEVSFFVDFLSMEVTIYRWK